jgi:hypothetical protein
MAPGVREHTMSLWLSSTRCLEMSTGGIALRALYQLVRRSNCVLRRNENGNREEVQYPRPFLRVIRLHNVRRSQPQGYIMRRHPMHNPNERHADSRITSKRCMKQYCQRSSG